jgi:acyl dehydratase
MPSKASEVGLRYEVEAFNTATASANRIHDDEVAQRFGFRGGLVPGVDVYAYLCHLPAERWGRAWLERGTMTARFRTPVYDGDLVVVSGEPDGDGGSGEALVLELRDPRGQVCAVGRASLPNEPVGEAVGEAPEPGEWPAGEVPDDPPAVSPEALQAGPFGQLTVRFHGDLAGSYLDEVREDLPLFRGPEGPAHPAWLLRHANYVLSNNVRLGPWIHTESTVQHWSTVGDGDVVETRALVTAVRERKGHQLVDLDVLQVVGERVVARTAHTAIYQLRDSERP